MKQLEVQIMGQSYLLGCPENGDARMLDAVNRVDMAMCKIRDAGKIKARDRIAVLAALNLAFELPERSAVSLPTPAAASPKAPAQATGDAPVRREAVGSLAEHGKLLEVVLEVVIGFGPARTMPDCSPEAVSPKRQRGERPSALSSLALRANHCAAG